MKKLLLLAMVFISVLMIVAGCSGGGSHNGYGKDQEPEVIYEVKVNENGGITAVTHSAITISADSETFAGNKDITVYITEIKEPSGVSSLFKVASKCYKISAQTKNKVEVIEVFKSVRLSIDSYASPTSDIFIGTKSPDNEDWSYDCVKSNLSSSVRAAAASKIDYELYRLGSTVAVFAADSEAVSKLPTVTNLTVNNLEIPAKDGKFTEDAEMCLTLSGLNLDSVKNTDCQVRLSYEYVNKDMKLVVSGGTASHKVSDALQGSGNSSVHTIDIVNITKTESVANEISLKFTLGLKNKEVLLMPDRFNIVVRSTSKSEKFKALPFCISSTTELKAKTLTPTPTDDIPVPTDVVANYNEETKVVSANWAWSGTDKNVEYLIKIANTSVSGAGSYIFSGIRDTKWDSGKTGLVLSSGTYEITVSATTASGTSNTSTITDKSRFTVKNGAPVPTPTDDIPVPSDVVASYNEETKVVSANWAWSGTDKNVEYLIKIANTSVSGAGSYNFSGIRDTKWDSGKTGLVLASGNYEITVSATTASGISKTSEVTNKAKFSVSTPVWSDSLTDPVINLSKSEYDYNSNVTITWEPSQYKSIAGNTGEIKYTVYADLAKQPETVIASDISETKCILGNAKTGIYLIKVVATANGLTATSEIVSFNVKQPVVGKPVITTPQYVPLNTDIDIVWEAADNAISYNVYIYAGSVLPHLPSVSNITNTSCKAKNIITDAGVYNVVVEAVNGETKTLSDSKEMIVDLAPVEPTNITITNVYAGNKATITWTEGNKALDVTYYVNILQNDNVITSCVITDAIWDDQYMWNEQYLATGSYKFEISAKNPWGQSASATADLKIFNNTIRAAEKLLGLKPVVEVVLDFPVSDDVKNYISGKVYIASESTVVETTNEWLSNVASPTLQIKPVNRLVNKSNYSFGMKSDALSEFNAEYCLSFPNEQVFYYENGNGTSENPYLVYDAESLNDVRNDLDAYYKQVCDIDLTAYSSGEGWLPIGEEEENDRFKGQFDGCGYTITNLKITRPGSDNIGLFGYTSNNAEVINCKIVNAIISGNNYVGSLVGCNSGKVNNCYVNSSTVNSQNNNSGGLVGHNEGGTITECYVVSSTVSSSINVGGLVGDNDNGTISKCYVASSTISGDNAGGLVGENDNGTVSNCYVASSTINGGMDAGGLVGYAIEGQVDNCYAASSSISSNDNAGGLVGYNSNGTISNSFACGNMKVNDSASEVLFGNGSGSNCYYWADGYKQGAGDWEDWPTDIWLIPSLTGSYSKESPCLPKLKCFN